VNPDEAATREVRVSTPCRCGQGWLTELRYEQLRDAFVLQMRHRSYGTSQTVTREAVATVPELMASVIKDSTLRMAAETHCFDEERTA